MTKFADQLDRIKVSVMKKIPFLSSLLREARIIETELSRGPACTTPEGHIFIDPEQMKEMNFREQAFTLAHEVMHCVNFHAKRGQHKEDGLKWNFATDAVINYLLNSLMRAPDWVIGPRTMVNTVGKDVVAVEDVEKMSDNELYELLTEHYDYEEKDVGTEEGERASFDKLPDVVAKNPMYGEGDEDSEGDEESEVQGDLSSEEKDGEVVQEGGDFNDAEDEEKRTQWKRNLTKAATQQKMAGKVPASLERYIDDMLKPDLDVRSLIKQQIHDGLGNLVIDDWRREGRKHPKLPGNKMLTTPTIWALVDTSGSISKMELKLFLGAIYEFASRADIAVIPWDADSYEVTEATNKSQVLSKIAKSLEGGGGTVVLPVLKKVLKEMSPRDIVCTLTDGGIADIEEEETQDCLRKVNEGASTCFFATTDQEVESDGWKCLEMGKR